MYGLLILESSLQSENVTYRPHAACSCVKSQSKRTYGIHTTDIYNNIYINCIAQLASVGLAQAHPIVHCHTNNAWLQINGTKSLDVYSALLKLTDRLIVSLL